MRYIFNTVPKSTSNGSDIGECVSHLIDVGIGVGHRLSHNVNKARRFVCRQTKCGDIVGDNIGRSCKVHVSCCRKVQDVRKSGQHFCGIPSGKTHVVQSICRFACRVFARFGQVDRRFRKLIHLCRGSSGSDGSYLRHCRLKIGGKLIQALSCRDDRSRDSCSHNAACRPHPASERVNISADVLEFLRDNQGFLLCDTSPVRYSRFKFFKFCFIKLDLLAKFFLFFPYFGSAVLFVKRGK